MKKPFVFLGMPEHYGFSQAVAGHLRGLCVGDLNIPPYQTITLPKIESKP